MRSAKPHVDSGIFDFHFECAECPPTLGIFFARASKQELDAFASTHQTTLRCPRGHQQTWTNYRGFLHVDSWGYAVDRHHPLWIDYNEQLTAEYMGSKTI